MMSRFNVVRSGTTLSSPAPDTPLPPSTLDPSLHPTYPIPPSPITLEWLELYLKTHESKRSSGRKDTDVTGCRQWMPHMNTLLMRQLTALKAAYGTSEVPPTFTQFFPEVLAHFVKTQQYLFICEFLRTGNLEAFFLPIYARFLKLAEPYFKASDDLSYLCTDKKVKTANQKDILALHHTLPEGMQLALVPFKQVDHFMSDKMNVSINNRMFGMTRAELQDPPGDLPLCTMHTLIHIQGSTSYSEIYSANLRGRKVCIKIWNTPEDSSPSPHPSKAVIESLKKLLDKRDDRVVPILGYHAFSSYRMLVMEMMVASVYDLLMTETVVLTWKRRLEMAQDAVRGMRYVHLNFPLHGAMKSGSVLLDQNGRYVITSFGQGTKSRPHDIRVNDYALITQHMAPETFSNHHTMPSKITDIFALGIFFWQIAARKRPDGNVKVVEGERYIIPPDTPPLFTELIKDCWAQNPADRPTLDEIVARVDEAAANVTEEDDEML